MNQVQMITDNITDYITADNAMGLAIVVLGILAIVILGRAIYARAKRS